MTSQNSKSAISQYSLWVGRSVLFLGLGDLLIRSQGMVLFPIFARKLGAYDYGIWSLVLITVTVASLIAGLGLGSSMIRYLAKEKGKEGLREGFYSIFFTVLLSSTILASVFFLIAEPFTLGLIGDSSVLLIIQIAALAPILDTTIQVVLTYFTTTRQMKKLAFFRLGSFSFNVVFIGCALLLGHGLLGTVSAMVLSKILFLFIPLLIVISQIGFSFPRFVELKPYLKFGIPLIMVGGFGWIIASCDRYVIGYFLDATSVGIYSAGHGLGILPALLATPIGLVLYSSTSKSYDEGNEVEARNLLGNGLKYYLMFAIPAASGLSVLAGHILSVVGTTEFIPGSAIVPFIAFGIVCMMCFSLVAERILTLVKKTTLIAGSLGIAALLNIALNFILIPRIGVVGAAIATLIALMWLLIPVSLASKKYLTINFNFTYIARTLFSSAIMSFVIFIIPLQEGLISLLILVIVGALTYLITMFLTRGITLRDIRYLRELVLSRRKEA